jgi:hypothetical protein
VETSGKILVTVGTLLLVYAFLTGFAMARARMTAAVAPRNLVNLHMESLVGGGILVALTVAMTFAKLPSGLANLTATLLAAGVVSAVAGATLNWQQDIEDAFASKPVGFYLQSAAGPLNVAGIVLLAIGVLRAL